MSEIRVNIGRGGASAWTRTKTDSVGLTDAVAVTAPVHSSGGGLKIIGFSTDDSVYSAKLAEVGPTGINARRVYGDLTTSGNSKSSIITSIISSGMLPVVSYKLNGVSFSAAASGSCDAAALATANYLVSLDTPIHVAVWHEPEDDMTGSEFKAFQRRLIPFFQRGKLKVGLILHGFNLDTTANTTLFKGFIDSTLLAGAYNWFGIDSYSNSTKDAGDRIAPLMTVLSDLGQPDMPIGIGEWNGATAAKITSAGNKFLANPNLIWACFWQNASSSLGPPLSGDRLTAFQAVKADSRVLP